MSNPLPPSSGDNGAHVFLLASLQLVFLGDIFQPKDAKDSTKAYGVEGSKFGKIRHHHPPAFRSIQERGHNTTLVKLQLCVAAVLC